jgi:hypothetical protein
MQKSFVNEGGEPKGILNRTMEKKAMNLGCVIKIDFALKNEKQ